MPLSGLLVHAVDQYPASARPAVISTFGLGDEPAVLVVVPGSAAARAGLQVGDGVVSLSGKAFPLKGSRKKASYERVQEFEEFLIASLAAGPVAVEFLRGGMRHSAVLEPEPGCISRVQLVPSEKLNAAADGTYAQLTTGIVNFARGDDEIALVVAHEMAHNILGHRVRLNEQKISRGLLKSLDGSAGKIRKTEVEADYLALYLLARAGFDIGVAPGFWQRYGPNALFEIFSEGTHPGRATRVSATRRTIEEIRMKQRQGAPLVPNLPAS
jgi:membrane-associated protease RseP (regulator of RpoE activity)